MKKIPFKAILLVLLGIVAVGGLAWLFLAPEKPAAQPQSLTTVVVQRGNIEQIVEGSGTAQPAEQKDVLAGTTGTVRELAVQDGAQVMEGQVLARLDSETANLNVAKAQISLQKAQQQLQDYLKQVGNLDVKASQAGEVTGLNVKEGQEVRKGDLLLQLEEAAHLEITAPFNSSQVSSIKAGQAADVFLTDFFQSVPGLVTKVERQGKPGSQGGVLYQVTVSLKNPGAANAGQQGMVTVATPQGDMRSVDYSTLAVPEGVEVRAETAGTVSRLAVEEGDVVVAGQQLLAMESDSLEQQVTSQRLSVQQAELELQSAQRTLQDMTLTAPVTGTVTALPVKVGDDVRMGDTIATVSDYRSMQIVVQVDELDIANLRPGMEAQVTADALPGKTFAGKVDKIADQGKAQNGVSTFDVTVIITEPGELKVGMSVDVVILVAGKKNVLLLPIEAVQQQNGRSFVMLPAGQASPESQSSPRMQQVQTGISTQTMIEIVQGLKEGQEVLIVGSSGQQRSGGGMFFGGGPMGVPRAGGGGIQIQRSSGGSSNRSGGGQGSGGGAR